jgi:flagellar basal body-associated protein FliL
LLNQISDKDLDEIRGGAGQNRLRREVRDQFNSVLFPDGYDRIFSVLFNEYNVQ